jgi:RNA polymerase sigma-70 factor (ECF subfamily)
MEQIATAQNAVFLGQKDNNVISELLLDSTRVQNNRKKRNRSVTDIASQKVNFNKLLVELASSRDKQVFSELFSYFAPRLKSMLMGTGTDPETAEEVAQEAMISVWRKCEMYDPKKASASTWIFTIARNLRIDRFRSERRPEFDANDPSLMPEAEPLAEDQLIVSDRQAVVKNAIALLPEDQKTVISLSFVEGLSHQEISDRLNLPLGTVKSRLRLSFEKLRTSLRSQI